MSKGIDNTDKKERTKMAVRRADGLQRGSGGLHFRVGLPQFPRRIAIPNKPGEFIVKGQEATGKVTHIGTFNYRGKEIIRAFVDLGFGGDREVSCSISNPPETLKVGHEVSAIITNIENTKKLFIGLDLVEDLGQATTPERRLPRPPLSTSSQHRETYRNPYAALHRLSSAPVERTSDNIMGKALAEVSALEKTGGGFVKKINKGQPITLEEVREWHEQAVKTIRSYQEDTRPAHLKPHTGKLESYVKKVEGRFPALTKKVEEAASSPDQSAAKPSEPPAPPAGGIGNTTPAAGRTIPVPLDDYGDFPRLNYLSFFANLSAFMVRTNESLDKLRNKEPQVVNNLHRLLNFLKLLLTDNVEQNLKRHFTTTVDEERVAELFREHEKLSLYLGRADDADGKAESPESIALRRLNSLSNEQLYRKCEAAYNQLGGPANARARIREDQLPGLIALYTYLDLLRYLDERQLSNEQIRSINKTFFTLAVHLDRIGHQVNTTPPLRPTSD